MLDFAKYNGTTNPTTHLKLYVGALCGYGQNEQLYMLLFQHNLAGTALQWFARLNLQTVRNWEELSWAFLAQYRHNMDIGVTQITLTQELKRKHESFKEYVIRWRDLAFQLETRTSERRLFGPSFTLCEGSSLTS